MDTNAFVTVTAALGAVVTAVATIALWRVTAVLAKETTRMADASGQPQIVATIRTNKWTMMYADLIITNSGNASAFSIMVEFDPPLEVERENVPEDRQIAPLQNISILRPGESLSSDVGKAFPMLDKDYRVTTSWLRHPAATEREYLSYSLSMADYKGVRRIGNSDPLIQIAQEVKHIREDWRSVASGGRKIGTDIYTSHDRLRERREIERERRAWNRRAAEQKARQANEQPDSEPSDSDKKT